uniref:Cytochrome b561 domain-containing protein n=1 Tax=Heterorhabditis bacteriophora TaxID=37862 RepID=A0A1I7XUN8_HETBA
MYQILLISISAILQTNYPSRSNSDKLKIAHGILMVLSWIVFLAIGIIFARYFKRFYSDTRICGTDVWFHVHRALNMVGIVGSVCGFVMIFVANDWRWKGPTAFQSAECKIHQKGRLIFNWIHRFLGLGAWLCGASAIMIACVHFNLMFNNHDAAFGLFLVFLSVSGFTLIAMEFINIKTWWLRRRGTSSELEVTQFEKPYILVVLLIFFVVVAIGCAIAICTLIGLKPID